MTKTAALIVAAGKGVRMGGDVPKQYQRLGGLPVLTRTISSFADHAEIDVIQVVIGASDEALYHQAVAFLNEPMQAKLTPLIFGAATRQGSVLNGLQSLAKSNIEKILIHDAARPLVTADTIARVVAELDISKAVLPALPVTDTLKQVDDGTVQGTISRDNLWRAQTPQGFSFNQMLSAHEQTTGQALTDDIAVAQAVGMAIAIVEGNAQNIKLTTQEDFAMAEKLIDGETRIGQGFDVHAFEAGDAVTLCGISIPHSHSLQGHSDADVAMHALTDALFGAIGAGDIGDHFPPSDPQWKGAVSTIFLTKAATLIEQSGGTITNIDLTLICEAPKIGPHRGAMRAKLAELLSLELSRISVKATTTERLGFTGRGEGIAAQAVVSIKMPV
ncbi:MAG: bifunctional 2-C-methyl-D-erythritol 4-phosphate cytidylyltransferase/2-C-methyl-D-erythritol 2,4-cyclodiphosphate synthase [Parvularculaceae bacterium]